MVQESALAESRAALGRESAARRRLHNLVQELRGNIRVFVRVKPAEPTGRAGAPVLTCEDSHRISCAAAGSTKVLLPCSPTPWQFLDIPSSPSLA